MAFTPLQNQGRPGPKARSRLPLQPLLKGGHHPPLKGQVEEGDGKDAEEGRRREEPPVRGVFTLEVGELGLHRPKPGVGDHHLGVEDQVPVGGEGQHPRGHQGLGTTSLTPGVSGCEPCAYREPL